VNRAAYVAPEDRERKKEGAVMRLLIWHVDAFTAEPTEDAVNDPICTGDGDGDDARNRVRAKLSILEPLTFPVTTARPSA